MVTARRVAGIAGALIMVITTASCGADHTGPLVSPGGFRAYLDHAESDVASPSGPMIAWRTTWRLTWDPVPNATRYAVHYGTSEGKPSGPPDHTETAAELRIEAAAGTSAAERLVQDRGAALATTAAQLMVAIAPVGPDGIEGPGSSWFPVGEVPAGGVPIGAG